MRFVHVGDLHLGKVIHQYSMLDIQRELLDELLEYMDKEDIRLLVIAGDVYDRLIPSQEAVNLLDEFLVKALLTYHIEVLMISGNHDSSDRMHFASHILSSSGLYIETYLKKNMSYVEKEGVRFYMLPYIKPSAVKALYQLDEVNTYQEALDIYLSHQEINKDYKNILITHQFVGHSSIVSDSEIPLSVGGSEIIDASLFKDFDYVALGHLHAPQKVSRETMRYSGSLMRYSFDEVKQNKSIVIVDTKDMNISFYELHPSQTLQRYKATFKDFMNPSYISNKQDFLSFELEDSTLIPHAIDQLRVIYPYLLQITYSYIINQQNQISSHSIQSIEQMDTMTLFENFYKEMKEQVLDSSQQKIVSDLLEKVGNQDENH
ncbi:MAG: exonuclease SbcCD subunit D [Coprobacillus sp.]